MPVGITCIHDGGSIDIPCIYRGNTLHIAWIYEGGPVGIACNYVANGGDGESFYVNTVSEQTGANKCHNRILSAEIRTISYGLLCFLVSLISFEIAWNLTSQTHPPISREAATPTTYSFWQVPANICLVAAFQYPSEISLSISEYYLEQHNGEMESVVCRRPWMSRAQFFDWNGFPGPTPWFWMPPIVAFRC